MKPIDLTKITKNYTSGWIALSSDYKKVAGWGKTLRSAIAQAKTNGEEKPVLLKGAKSYGPIAI